MKPASFMLIAGEASGDQLAAELVRALRQRVIEVMEMPTEDAQPLHTGLEPRFLGAGGLKMAEAGVELALDLTRHSVVGLWEVIKNYGKFRRIFSQLLRFAIERQPDVIIGVDYGGFNLRFAAAIRRYSRTHRSWFRNWNPKLVQFVSPQVWASRGERAYRMERDLDLLLTIFPFERSWYAQHTPKLRVEFVGHPIFDRYPKPERGTRSADTTRDPSSLLPSPSAASVLLLPGSRAGELKNHLPVMLGALELMRDQVPGLRARMVLPNEDLMRLAISFGLASQVETQTGGLANALDQADIAVASTGTVTVECAYFGVPTVALYKTSWSTYQIAKRLVRIKFAAMPNLLAGEEFFPEFIQSAATPENIAAAGLRLLTNETRRQEIQVKLAHIVASLGGPGATQRAAEAIVRLLVGAHGR